MALVLDLGAEDEFLGRAGRQVPDESRAASGALTTDRSRPRWIIGPIGGVVAILVIIAGGSRFATWAHERDCGGTLDHGAEVVRAENPGSSYSAPFCDR